MNPETHHNITGKRKRNASDTRDNDDDSVNHSQVQPKYASPSNYMINGGGANITMVCCPCIHCPLGWHESGMPMPTREVAKQAPDIDALPSGFRFTPTDKELIVDYLIKKIKNESVPKSRIFDADIYACHPEVLEAKYPQATEDTWYFFTPRNRKYANGTRPDRQAGPGYWKATGPDKYITENDVNIGRRKSLVYHIGHPPKLTKTKWMMHEYVILGYVRTRLNSKDKKLDDYVISKIYLNGKKPKDKDEGDTDLGATNVAPNVRVENEPVLVNDDQPVNQVASNQDADPVSVHGENNVEVSNQDVDPISVHGEINVVVSNQDVGTCMSSLPASEEEVRPTFQVENNVVSNQDVGTCMSSLVASEEEVRPTFQVENNVVPQNYQNNMQSIYDLMPPYSPAGYSSTIFNHEYSPLPPYNVMYGSGSTSNYSPLFANGFVDDGYQFEFDGSNGYLL